jgi:hypothetical protein
MLSYNVLLYGLDSFGLWWRPVEVSYEYDNKPTGSMKYWEIVE